MPDSDTIYKPLQLTVKIMPANQFEFLIKLPIFEIGFRTTPCNIYGCKEVYIISGRIGFFCVHLSLPSARMPLLSVK